MSVLMRDLWIRGSANMPDIDGVLTGGAIAWNQKVSFVDIVPNGFMDLVSSASGDTAVQVSIQGRDPTGIIQTQVLTTNGLTPVTGNVTFERMMKSVVIAGTGVGDIAVFSHTQIVSGSPSGAVAAANATGTTDASVTLATGQGASCAIGDVIRLTNNVPAGMNGIIREIISLSGDVAYVNADWTSGATVPTSGTTYIVSQGMLFNLTYANASGQASMQVTQVRRPFYNAASDVPGGATRNYYEKLFAININTATALTSASIVEQVAPSAGILFFQLTSGAVAGSGAGLNDTNTTPTRQTAPASGGLTAAVSGAGGTINIPNTNQALPSGVAPNSAGSQAIWVNLQLAAGLSPTKTSFTLRIAGQTT